MSMNEAMNDQPVGLRERPNLAVLRYINPADFGPHHLRQLYRLEKHSWDGLTALMCAARIAAQDMWLWEVGDNDEHAIVLTSLLVDPAGGILWIEGAAGNGILAAAGDIVGDLRLIADFYGARRVRATSERDGFESLPDKLGFKAVSTIWELETEDERRQQAASDPDSHSED